MASPTLVLDSIRRLRQQKGYSQEYMAFMMDMSQNNYSKLERGATPLTINKLYDVAEILEVTVHEILPPVRPAFGINWPGITRFYQSITAGIVKAAKSAHRRLFARKP